jgi:NAD+ synthase (glutamine-hydrolysing)
MDRPFASIYSHGYVRCAVCVPEVRVAAPGFNAGKTLELARRASDAGAAVALFPELGISAYTCDDLFHQDALLDAVEREVGGVIEASRELGPLLLVGAPLRAEAKLFNCALAIHRGRLLGVAVKSYLPNYREFYEKRYFAAARQAAGDTLRVAGHQAPFGADLVFEAVDYPGFRLHVEICEDLWTPVPPSTWAALGGATVLANLSASNVTIGKADFRRALCAAQSGRCLAAYLFAAAGPGESTTDLAWDGQALIYENAELLAEGERFPREGRMITADVDHERLRQERMRLTSFSDAVADHRGHTALRTVGFELDPPAGEIALERTVDRFPYVPPDTADLDERCYEAYEIQVQGLVKRLQATGIDKLVLGVSGGLDSTQALIVATKALDRLGLPRGNLLAYTLIQRERLGSTGIGNGIAIPHGRVVGLDHVVGVFARLDEPIEFEAIDDKPVDLIFVLLAPEGSGADHLKALARVARLLRGSDTAAKLRATDDAKSLYGLLTRPSATAA